MRPNRIAARLATWIGHSPSPGCSPSGVDKGTSKSSSIDLIALFRGSDPEKIENLLYQLRKNGENLGLNLHVEPIIIDSMFDQKVYPLLLHEGFSINCSEFIHKKLNLRPFTLITYLLESKKASDKVRFSYAAIFRFHRRHQWPHKLFPKIIFGPDP